MPYLQDNPRSLGYRRRDTSLEAVEQIGSKAPALRLQVLEVLSNHGPRTADEIAKMIGADRLSIRPHVTELLNGGLIEATKERRTNASGKKATVFRLKRPGDQIELL